MPYDKSLDEQVFSESFDTKNGRITVSVYSYNQGAKKLQITREARNAEGNYIIAKLGRLSKEELEAILPMFQKALAQM